MSAPPVWFPTRFAARLDAAEAPQATQLPDGPPQAAGAPSRPPHGPCREWTTGEAAAYRQGQEDERVRIAAMILSTEDKA